MPFFEPESTLSLHYEETGAGAPLVLLHGWAMSSRAFALQMEPLARGHRVIALDLRGHGRSGVGDFGLDALARDLTALFDHLRLDRAAVAGWSLGALVALAAAPALGDRLGALALLAGTARFTSDGGYPHGLAAARVRALRARAEKDLPGAIARFFDGMFAAGEVAEAERAALRERVVAAARLPDAGAVRGGLDLLLEADLRATLGGVDVPVLLVHGDADPVILPGASRFLAERLPRARLEIVPGAGHAPFLSRPQAVNAFLLRFLGEVG